MCDDTNVRSEAKMTIRAGNDLEKAMDMFHLIGTDPRVLDPSEETTALAGDILANLSDSKTLRTPVSSPRIAMTRRRSSRTPNSKASTTTRSRAT